MAEQKQRRKIEVREREKMGEEGRGRDESGRGFKRLGENWESEKKLNGARDGGKETTHREKAYRKHKKE